MDNAQAVIDLTVASTEMKDVDGTPIAIVPTGYKVVEMSQWLSLPMRKKGQVTLDALASFVAYVNKHKTPETAIYFTDVDERNDRARMFTAVLDDHGTAPGWKEFRAMHLLGFSRQWLEWSKRDERSQHDFALFLEDRVGDVLVPDGAKLFEIVSTLEATQTASYSAAIKLGNGDVRFSYSKDTKAGNGTLEMPPKITLKIPIWERSEPEEIVVKLRYRLREDRLTFRLEIDHREELLDAAIDEAVEAVRAATGVPVYFGSL